MRHNTNYNKKPKRQLPDINIQQVTYSLSRTFDSVVEDKFRLQKAVKGTELYRAQVDFAYLIDDVMRGPAFQVPSAIASCKQYINRLK